MSIGDRPSPGGYHPPSFGLGQFLLSLGVTGAILSGMVLIDVGRIVPRPKPQTLVVLDLLPPPPPPAAFPPPSVEPRPDAARPPVETPVVPPPIVRAPAVTPIAAAPSLPMPAGPPALPTPAPPALADMGDLSASMVSARPPSYPLASRRAREQGTVVISVRLGIDGRVYEASVTRSSGHDRLDHAALDAVRRWRWSPTVRAGEAIEVIGLVRIPFVLRK